MTEHISLRRWETRRMACQHALLVSTAITLLAAVVVAADAGSADTRAKKFIDAHVAKIKPLEKAAGIAWWDANTSGKDEDFQRKEDAQNKIDAVLSDPVAFRELKSIKESGQVTDKLLARQIEVIYLGYLEKQVDPLLLREMVSKSNAIEKAFNVYRAEVDGKKLTENDVRKVLKESKNSDERRKTWEGSKGVGAVVEKDLIALAKLRNQAASQLGFANYHQLMLHLNEQEQPQIMQLFDELDELTREPFRRAKAEFDERLAANCGVNVDDLRPWHYHDPFFQESPAVFGTDLDAIYKQADILKLCREFYIGIELPIDDVLARSDLFEKPGKSPHAFCTDIDREGDVRVLANIVPSERWMDTMLHELGHSVYSSKNIPQSVPHVLRGASHILTTEGLAMMMGRLGKNGVWQEQMGIAPRDPAERKRLSDAGAKVLRNQLLIFSRWCQVMLRFEKGLYDNPDQDLNKLWWNLVEKYQLLHRPDDRNAPDYGSKIHIVGAPVYYHNYMMGELFASQVHHTIAREVCNRDPRAVAYVRDPKVGDFLKEKVIAPGQTLSWNELTKFATGEDLNPRAFAEDFRAE
ncbi:MAG TPA: M2 family metallopeptidase [Planctomycetaceae bacterium]|nr:M2 family metallopeptidase [Planctomycetaceae bacterium]